MENADVGVTTTAVASSGRLFVPLINHETILQRRRRRRRNLAIPAESANTKHQRPHFSRHDPRFLLLPSSAQTAGLYQGYGTNYADLWCGTPKGQRQTVIVDTGSGITAFPCQDCRHQCGVPQFHLDALYNGPASTTFRTLNCQECLNGNCLFFWDRHCTLTRMYAEGSSWRATEVADQCYVGGYHTSPVPDKRASGATILVDPINPLTARSFELKFGCQSSITGLFVQQLADGIMGMDYAKTSFWWQMHTAGKIDQRAFSLCMGRSQTIETPVGVMSLGGTTTTLHDVSTMVFATMKFSSMGYYNIKIRAMYLHMPGSNSTPMKLDDFEPMEQVIVDSGTTDSYFSRTIAESFEAAYLQVTGRPYTNDPKTSYSNIQDLQANEPTILLQIYGDTSSNQAIAANAHPGSRLAGGIDSDNPLDIIVAIPPDHYYEYDGTLHSFQSRFFVNERGVNSILGANILMGHDVLFDMDHRRLGFAESTCNYTALTAGFPIPPSTLPERQEHSYDEEETIMCSSRICQYGILFCLVALIFICIRYLARRRRVRSYDRVAADENGLEMSVDPNFAMEGNGSRYDRSRKSGKN